MPEQLNLSRKDRNLLKELSESIDNLAQQVSGGSTDELDELLRDVEEEMHEDLELDTEDENLLDDFIYRVSQRISHNGGGK